MKLLIYVPLLGPRIKYIFSFIFNEILKTDIDFTIDPDTFRQSAQPKLSYANQPIGNELFFKSTNLLFEYKIVPQQINTTEFGAMKAPFRVIKSSLPFDIFAATFYFLSRYEEYIHFETQKTEAFPFEDSLQYRLKLLKLPVIDHWALILKNILLKQYPDLIFGNKHFTFQPIYIGLPSNREGFFSTTMNTISSFIDNKLRSKSNKIAGIKRIIADMQHFGAIKTLDFAHSSQHSEHHFIDEFQIPKSYIKLTKLQTKNDYRMYYPDYPGFRAGTCTPFSWYDLQMEKTTQLLLHPVVATDLNLLKHKTAEVLSLQMNELISSVKLVNGDFYFLSLCNDIRPQ